jgi:hypothetical protein
MTGKKEPSDSRLNVARYQIDRMTPAGDKPDDEPDTAGQPTMEERAQYVEVAIQQAIRRGDFDNLPGSGKPLRNLQQAYDPNWWIRQKIERENITGLGPPALTLRTENAGLDERVDAAASETTVRDILEDFNKRVIEARRQLQGGPPVVTPTRDIDDEVTRWRDRRTARYRALEEERERQAAAYAAMNWRERRRARRGR